MSERVNVGELTGDPIHDLPILSEAVCLTADAYTDCVAEFSDTAAGDLSASSCGELLEHLTTAVNRWKGCQTMVLMRRRSGR